MPLVAPAPEPGSPAPPWLPFSPAFFDDADDLELRFELLRVTAPFSTSDSGSSPSPSTAYGFGAAEEAGSSLPSALRLRRPERRALLLRVADAEREPFLACACFFLWCRRASSSSS